MTDERRVRGDGAAADCDVPAAVIRKLDLADDAVDHRVDEVTFVRDVVVERHRLDAERLRELSHREGFEPVAIGERDRLVEDAVAVEWSLLRRHLTDLHCTYSLGLQCMPSSAAASASSSSRKSRSQSSNL